MTKKILLAAICLSWALGWTARAEDLSTYKTADDLWAHIQTLEKGPQEHPNSQEDVPAVFHRFWDQFDAAVGAFRQRYPADSRRWEARLLQLQLAILIGQADKKPVAPALTITGLKEIIAATDAPEAIRQQAQAGVAELEAQAKVDAKQKEMKEKPLDLKFTTVDGTEFDLVKWRGKVVLVDFWATWCGPCRMELPHVVETYKKLHAKGFEIIGISLDQNKDKLLEFTKQKEMPWPQYFDGKVWQNKISTSFGIQAIPTAWLVDKKGFLRSTETRADLEQQVTKLLAE